MSTEGGARAWVEVRAGALRRNLLRIREAVGPGVGLLPMLKADAYGLGVGPAVTTLEPMEPWGYGVACVEEGEEIRALGVERPVLVLSPVPHGALERAAAADLTVTVSDVATLQRLQELAVYRMESASDHQEPATDDHDPASDHQDPLSFHLEIDTGMGRSGFDWRRVEEWGPMVKALSGVEGLAWRGCFTHFHSAEAGDLDSVREQWAGFTEALSSLENPEDAVLHACNSAAALRAPDLAADVVRPGIFMYGGAAGPHAPEPEPVVAVRARVVHLKDAPAGSTLGYGATHVADSDERWATLALGYGDGLRRSLENRGHALVRGRRVPIVGRISMDVTVVDISGVEGVELGDVATLVGSDGSETISLDEVAGLAGTISYEILTGLARRLPRIWMEDGAD